MQRNTKILLLGSAAAVGLLSYAYYRAAKQLTFGINNLQVGADGKVYVQLRVNNPSGFGFPVPVVNMGVFDNNDNYLGTIQSNLLQYIPAGGGFIEGVVLPYYDNLGNVITNYALGNLPTNLLLQGTIKVGSFNIPVQTSITTA